MLAMGPGPPTTPAAHLRGVVIQSQSAGRSASDTATHTRYRVLALNLGIVNEVASVKPFETIRLRLERFIASQANRF